MRPKGSWQRPALRLVAEAIFSRKLDAPLPGERLDYIERELFTTLDASGPRARTLFLLCLFGVYVLAPLWVWRLPTLTRLPLPLRIRALSRMEEGIVAAPLVLAIKAALCILYYEQLEAVREVGSVTSCLKLLTPQRPESAK